MKNKLTCLRNVISRYRSAVIAFSGGVDSTLLASVAGEVLGNRVLLVTVASPVTARSENREARSLAAHLGLPHRVMASGAASMRWLSSNPPDRCYFCKRVFFSGIKSIARKGGYEAVFDGSNADDRNDYRPGRRALAELGIVSPLYEAKLTKADVRRLSVQRRLPTAGKPSNACLVSRFPYGEMMTRERLRRVEGAEIALRVLGFRQFRVRSHGDCARVEVGRSEFDSVWRKRTLIGRACRKAGFVFVSIDTNGYRTGAMDEALKKKDHEIF
ncbi:MAG: ATP-dependent sacrificial sulfur transferase LarE [Chitinispirillaceae bacterium]|nr:ATP-dependent sacrificial sulfur transferase LarE [Chitinispirillaceae bacterium]